MNRDSREPLLQDTISLLVQHFGLASVKAAVGNASRRMAQSSKAEPRLPSTKPGCQPTPNVTAALEHLRQADQQKYRLLAPFYTELRERRVLVDSQDIRQFAQLVGLKQIEGKSRKDLVPKLMRFLLGQPIPKLQVAIPAAATVSERERQQGYSVLTDKLLAGQQGPSTSPQSNHIEEDI